MRQARGYGGFRLSDQVNLHGDPSGSRFALQRVILIDSYTEGRITELPLAGGTAITGRNGRGKTSLLRLIPAFYGERPDRIVKPVSNQKNFARYYLPRSTSYIVYEYRRDDIVCCAILCADQSGDGVEYRFARSVYQREWFVHDDETTLVASSNLLERLKLRGVICTRKMPLDQYRAIIQGKRAHGSDLKQHRRDILEYAFCPSSQPLPHIERIVFGMFMRKTNFADLQRMIVATVTDAGGQISLGAERKKIESWPDAFESYTAVMAEAHRMEAVQKAYDAVLAAEQELRNIHARFLSLDRSLEDDQVMKRREHEAAKQDLEKAEQEHSAALRIILDKLDQTERNLDAISGKLNQLSQKHASYQNQGVAAKATLLDREEEIAQARQHLESRKAALLSAQTNIEDEYRKILDTLRLEYTERLPNFERQRSEAREAHQARVDALSADFDQQECEVRQASASSEKGLQEAASLASEAVGKSKAQFTNPQPDLALVEIAEQQEAKVDDARAKHQGAIEHEGEAQKTYEAARNSFAHTENALRVSQAESQKLDQALKSLLMHASPDENSVLHVLRSQRPEWTQDIAKVLRDDILNRTDLSPIVGAIQDSVYGLQLDLELLDTPLVADESALQREIDAARETMQRQKDRVSQQEAILAQRSADRAAAEDMKGLKSSEAAIAKSALLSAEKQLKTARADVQRSREAAKEQARDAHDKAARHLDEATQRLSQHRVRLEQDVASLRARQQQRRDESGRTLEQLLVDIHGKEAAATKRFEDACAQVNTDRTAKLKERGIDTSALTELEQQIDAAAKEMKIINQSRNLILEWRLWLSGEWSQKSAHEEALTKVQSEKSVLEEAKVASVKAWHDDKSRRSRVISDLAQKLAELDTQRSRVASHRKALDPYPVNQNVLLDYDAAWTLIALVGQTSDQIRAVKMHEDRLRQEIDTLKRVFIASRNSPADQYYDTQRQMIGPDRSERPREWVPAFKAWFSSEHEHYRNLLRVDARTIAEAVGDFRDRMDTFHRKVQQFNRELQESLNSNQGFESIGSLSIEIVSSIRELEYWSTIEKVAESRREWMAGDLADLPPPDFAAALRELLNHWQLKEGILAELTNLVRIQGDVVENGNRRPFKKAEDLETISSNGLSYIVMVLIFVGFINRVRSKAPVNVVWALDEIKDLDIGNVELLMDILTKNNITLVSACPDPDPDVLALFRNRRSIRADRCIYDPSDVTRADARLIADEIGEVDNV